jgi:hypothetical protein
MFAGGARVFPRKRLVLAVAAVAALSVAVPVAWATFNDVPPSDPFYNDVNAIQGAGITSGCGGGNFCPSDNITREAEAAFAHRADGRVAQSTAIADGTIGLSNTASNDTLVGQVQIAVGGVSGGTQFVKVDANMANFFSSGTTPFQVFYHLSDGDCSGAHSPTMSETIASDPGDVTASISWTEAVPSGSTKTFALCAHTIDVGAAADTDAFVIDAATYPFGSMGGASLGPTAQTPDRTAERSRP